MVFSLTCAWPARICLPYPSRACQGSTDPVLFFVLRRGSTDPINPLQDCFADLPGRKTTGLGWLTYHVVGCSDKYVPGDGPMYGSAGLLSERPAYGCGSGDGHMKQLSRDARELRTTHDVPTANGRKRNTSRII